MSPEVLVQIAIAVLAIAALVVAVEARVQAKRSADAADRSADAAELSIKREDFRRALSDFTPLRDCLKSAQPLRGQGTKFDQFFVERSR